jgi:HK97 family phage major capsid protein
MKSNAKIQTGLRLFIAGLILYLGGSSVVSFILAAAVMLFPTWKYVKTKFAIGLSEDDAGKLLDKVKTQTNEQLNAFKKEISDLTTQVKSGLIDEKTFNEKMKGVTDKMEAFDPEKFKAFQSKLEDYQKKFDEQQKALEAQGTEIKKMKDGGADSGEASKSLRFHLKEFLKSDAWKEFVESDGKKKATIKLDRVSMNKAAVSVASNYTGTSLVHITTRDGRVVDHPEVTRLNIRDLMTVSPTDMPYLAFLEVYDWVRAVRTHSENESLAESSFKVREATADVKRIGTSIPISKRMLRSAAFIEGHLATRLPAQVRYHEDFQLLFGDGAGNNPTGIFKVADNFATVINTTSSGGAASVATIATYDGGAKTLVNFAANQNINNGDRITFANTSNYNDTFTALVIGPRQIVIDEAYQAETATGWTFTVESKFKNAIVAAQEIDVLKIAKTLVTRQEYSATGIVLHPDDATKIELLKGNDEHYLDVQRLENGVMTIGGVPVVETTAMPSGKFAIGDWALACALLEFTALTLEFSESTTEKLTNTVMAIAHEEILFPIYNKYMFIVGDFETAKAAIAYETES